ncbi:unnamed protein product, partial [marine sediment metagenome]
SLYYRSYTQEYGGYYISKPNVKFEIRLFDSRSGQVAWLATSLTKGNAFADYDALANSLAKKVVEMLIEEDMLELTVTDIKKATVSATKTITVTESLNQSPIVSFTANFRVGAVPLEIYFDASNSYDPDGNIISYAWDFKDGNTGSGEIVNHTFNSIGSYKVELIVTDNKGAISSATKTIIAKKSHN